ncbi:MAG: molybdenum cofactor biosynthesis protein MoaE [Burkholderiaceae bacterium]
MTTTIESHNSSRAVPTETPGASAPTGRFSVAVQTADFDSAAEVAALRDADARVGAVCSFLGVVRDRNEGSAVAMLELEHYPGMTERSIEAMIDAARTRFGLFGARVIHRIGLLAPCDQIVLVAVTAAHRGEAFQGCEFLMDYLKTHAPFWKKEQTPSGARWVDARASDDAALARWGLAQPTEAAGAMPVHPLNR